ncbi:hypothetical protein Tco_1497269, partial [Tanacetum coccineum]
HAKGRNSRARLSGGHIIRRLAAHFGLVSDDGLRASGPERQLDVTDGALEATRDAHAVDKGALADPAPIDVDRSITNQSRITTWMVSCMTQLMDASRSTYQAFDSTLIGSSRFPYQRHTRLRTGDASTSTSQQDEQLPDL